MDVVLTAGGTPQPGEPLYEHTRGGCKALLDIHGKPMIQWVLDALAGCPRIGNIVLIGLPKEAARLDYPRPLIYLDDQGNMLDNIITGVRALHQRNPALTHCLVAASDVPTITPAMIDWLVDLVEAGDDELYYLVIQREAMERTFPSSRRTYIRLKGMEICGGDVNAIAAQVALNPSPLWRKLIESRKNPLKQASILGFDILFGLLLGRYDLFQTVQKVASRLGLRGRAIVCPYAEMGMDIDKPYQLELVRSYLARRSG